MRGAERPAGLRAVSGAAAGCGDINSHLALTPEQLGGKAPPALNAVVLSHAHIDHSGDLPLLAKQGYRGPIYTTPATIDLCDCRC
jgi:metallo-beta-lactamase family protein